MYEGRHHGASMATHHPHNQYHSRDHGGTGTGMLSPRWGAQYVSSPTTSNTAASTNAYPTITMTPAAAGGGGQAPTPLSTSSSLNLGGGGGSGGAGNTTPSGVLCPPGARDPTDPLGYNQLGGSSMMAQRTASRTSGAVSAAAMAGASRTASGARGGHSLFATSTHSGGATVAHSPLRAGGLGASSTTAHSDAMNDRMSVSSAVACQGQGAHQAPQRCLPENTKSGWLDKFSVGRGLLPVRNWQRRWFTVGANGLNYSKGPKEIPAPRTYVPFIAGRGPPDVMLRPVFLLPRVGAALHPAAKDPRVCYFALRFIEGDKTHTLLLRTASAEERCAWVRFLSQFVHVGTPRGPPTHHPLDPSGPQRLPDPEDLEPRERLVLRRVVLEWDEGYQEYRHRIVDRICGVAGSGSGTNTPSGAVAGASVGGLGTTPIKDAGPGGSSSSSSPRPSLVGDDPRLLLTAGIDPNTARRAWDADPDDMDLNDRDGGEACTISATTSGGVGTASAGAATSSNTFRSNTRAYGHSHSLSAMHTPHVRTPTNDLF